MLCVCSGCRACAVTSKGTGCSSTPKPSILDVSLLIVLILAVLLFLGHEETCVWPRVVFRAVPPSAALLLPCLPECWPKHFIVAVLHLTTALRRLLARCWLFHGVPSWARTWGSQTPSRSVRNPVGKSGIFTLGGKLSGSICCSRLTLLSWSQFLL